MVTIRSSSSEVISPALVWGTTISNAYEGLAWPRLAMGGAGESIPLVQVHISLFANEVGVTASDALDLGEGIHDLLLAIDVGIEETKNELEVRLLSRDERCTECQPFAIVYETFPNFIASRSAVLLEDLHMMRDGLYEDCRCFESSLRVCEN